MARGTATSHGTWHCHLAWHVALPLRMARCTTTSHGTLQVARGIYHLHSCGICHRDMKPSGRLGSV